MEDYIVQVQGVREGITFGAALAIAISFSKNRSILWAILAGILGWIYVIYAALFVDYSK